MLKKQLSNLRVALLSLRATGADGFEGLLRITLTELTGIPFRLAASGLQGGIDGDAALQSDAVSFEAKRYTGKVDRNDVLNKIADLARNNGAPDRLWILGATTEINTQLASAIQIDGDRNAISTLILDWTAAPLPLLAVAVVATGDAAIDFLIEHFEPKPGRKKYNRKELIKAFQAISKHSDFDSLLQRLKLNLCVSELANARSITINKAWRKDLFGSADIARERLGQALAVVAQPVSPSLRIVLRKQVSAQLQNERAVILSAGEGQGKSWLAAQICIDHNGIALFASAERFDGLAPKDLDKFLIGLFIEQTGDVPSEAIESRWRHRLAAWKSMPPKSSVLVVVDGINQRQNLQWDRLLNGLLGRLEEIGGRLIVTVRPQFWHKEVAPGLAFKPQLIDVPEWTPNERDQLLTHYGIELNWLDEATLQTLSNPRLLGVAVATLPLRVSSAWKGLTTDRLLIEHLRASQREYFEEESMKKLTNRISAHAKEVLERASTSPNALPQNFKSDSTAVIETRFFHTLQGPGDTYELRNEGLTLALGYTLVDQLWQAQRSSFDLTERMTHLIDPILAMDRTTDVVFAALMVCALDPIRFDKTIFTSLLGSFSNLQNLSDQRFEEFVEIVKHQPGDFFNTLGDFTLERGHHINQDWFIHAAFEIAATENGKQVAEDAINRWLHCYNKNAAEHANRYARHNNAEDAKQLQQRQNEIQETLSSFSSFEKDLLGQMTEVSGEAGSLFTLALQLLAGRPLAGFADSFVAMGLGFSLDSGVWPARKAFIHLTTFNRVDRGAAKDAFLNAIKELQSSGPSITGQWTIVRMLYATGDKIAAIEAEGLAKKLQEGLSRFEPPSPDEWRQAQVADPNATHPIDVDAGLGNFRAQDNNKILQSMFLGGEDHSYRSFLPVACRFEARAAVEKGREILSGLLTRTGLPLRQLIFNSQDHSPLMTREMAVQLVARVRDCHMVETLAERERSTLRYFIFNYAASHLTASEQLACMADPAFGHNYILDVIPSLKFQQTETIISTLQIALDEGDEEAAYCILSTAIYGGTNASPDLEPLLLRCRSAALSKLRAVTFDLAISCDFKKIRKAHIQCEWSAHDAGKITFERWFGSILRIEACAKGELPVDEMLKRINRDTWFAAINRLGDAVAKPLAKLFLLDLQSAIEITTLPLQPAIDISISTVEPMSYPYLSLKDKTHDHGRFPPQNNIKDILGTNEDFIEKHDRLHAIVDAFYKELKDSNAEILVQRITIPDLRLLTGATPTFLEELLDVLEQATDAQFIWLKNLAFAVANLLSREAPERAIALFQRASKTRGGITYALDDGLTMEHEAIWASTPSEAMHELWLQRLFNSDNDATLAREVLAAERFGAAAFIKTSVEELEASTSTLNQAYAISIAGYSSQGGGLLDVIKNHMADQGITGDAAKHARASHDTAQWSEKWVKDMWAAQTAEGFWRCLMIAKTSVDARILPQPEAGIQWKCYVPLFRRVREAAIKEHNKNREKTLLGREAPDPIYLKPFEGA